MTLEDFGSPRWACSWPTSLLTAALSEVSPQDDGALASILEEAFEDSYPATQLAAAIEEFGRSESAEFHVALTEAAEAGELTQSKSLRPRRLDRNRADIAGRVSATEEQFRLRLRRLLDELERLGYFHEQGPKQCPDDFDTTADLAELLRAEYVEVVYPFSKLIHCELDLLLDVVEFLHDIASRPRTRSFHAWNNCGYHYSDFSDFVGKAVFRHRVNLLFRDSPLELAIAESGADVGRFVAATDDARSDLLLRVPEIADVGNGERVASAIASFRNRKVTRSDKRSAVASLAGILESHRELLKEHLLKKDEGSLFRIANEFDIRHHTEKQFVDYDDAFLDWLFWWYLATIELAETLLARQSQMADGT